MSNSRRNAFRERLRARAGMIKLDVPAICLALKHKDTPRMARVLAAMTVGYALSPVDLIPDFIPVLGALDDLIIVPALAAAAIRLIPSGVMDECREQAAGMWERGKPKRWYYAIPIILLWLLILWMLIKVVF